MLLLLQSLAVKEEERTTPQKKKSENAKENSFPKTLSGIIFNGFRKTFSESNFYREKNGHLKNLRGAQRNYKSAESKSNSYSLKRASLLTFGSVSWTLGVSLGPLVLMVLAAKC